MQKRGAGGGEILAYATLRFDVELVKVSPVKRRSC